jgi:sterol desaturase/sphingolipid hydroxylase (fatty acid hydroxylase superfamily)
MPTLTAERKRALRAEMESILGRGAVHHDVHHARVNGNYAGFLFWTDWVFGTLARGYGDELRARHSRLLRPAKSL